MNVNLCMLIGRVTRDPEVKNLPSGTMVANFGLATNYVYKDAAGAKQEKASFHNCVAFGKRAETIGQYVTKGQEIYVLGRIEYQEWEKTDGGKGYKTVIIVESFQFGQKAKGPDVNAVKERMKNVPSPAGAKQSATASFEYGVPVEPEEGQIDIKDIPF